MSEDYILEALKSGLTEIGFSDHGPIPRRFMSDREYRDNWLERQMNEDSFRSRYLPDLEKSISRYGDQIKIWKGLEIEYLPGNDAYYRDLLNRVEYLVLGIHYFPSTKGIFNTYEEMKPINAMEYAALAERALDTGFFTILAHPDLFLISYRDAKGNLVFDESARLASERIVAAAVRNHVFLEVNGGGPRRGIHATSDGPEWLYPRTSFWKVVERHEDARVVIGCDTHNPPELYDETIEEVLRFASRFHLNILPRIDIANERRNRT
jgi:histidinol-phosphatase (PHP family)